MTEVLLQEIRGLRKELQEFRDDVSSWQQEFGERVASLEVKIKPAIEGNGQPSRLAVAEKDISDLKSARLIQTGFTAGVSAIISFLLSATVWYLRSVHKP